MHRQSDAVATTDKRERLNPPHRQMTEGMIVLPLRQLGNNVMRHRSPPSTDGGDGQHPPSPPRHGFPGDPVPVLISSASMASIFALMRAAGRDKKRVLTLTNLSGHHRRRLRHTPVIILQLRQIHQRKPVGLHAMRGAIGPVCIDLYQRFVKSSHSRPSGRVAGKSRPITVSGLFKTIFLPALLRPE